MKIPHESIFRGGFSISQAQNMLIYNRSQPSS